MVAFHSFNQSDWQQSRWVTLYPVNGDASPASSRYIESLRQEQFWAVENFVNQHARHYLGQDYPAIRVRLASPLSTLPPHYPAESSLWGRLWWSLQIRWWRLQLDDAVGEVILLQFYDPQQYPTLSHSMGLPQLSLGVVKAFAAPSQASLNNVVVVHELLHLYGASDKYDAEHGRPLYPEGYAEPDLTPRYPQRLAEVMAGSIPLTESESQRAVSLQQLMIGPVSAAEIGWQR